MTSGQVVQDLLLTFSTIISGALTCRLSSKIYKGENYFLPPFWVPHPVFIPLDVDCPAIIVPGRGL